MTNYDLSTFSIAAKKYDKLTDFNTLFAYKLIFMVFKTFFYEQGVAIRMVHEEIAFLTNMWASSLLWS